MRIASTLPLAAVAAAIVVPNTNDVKSWQEFLPSKESVHQSVDDFVSTVKHDFDAVAKGVEDVIASTSDTFSKAFEDVTDEFKALGGHHDNPHRKYENVTIYEAIKNNEHTKKFAALVDEHESIVKLLNSTKANYTLFAPTDEAFEHIPDHHGEKPSKEFVEALLKYHVGVGLYPAQRILVTHTIPSALEESLLGDKPQRLRTSVGLTGVRVNFYDKVVFVNAYASNGVIHAVNHILVPPPVVGRILTLFPAKFSTLLLAYDKTDFVDFIHHVPMKGSTVFAPSNTAFERLGPGANAFLFNTEKGLKYLKGLLKYHIVANQTLYSDAYYRSGGDDDDKTEEVKVWDDDVQEQGLKHYHVDLPSLLDEENISVDITRWAGFIDVRINGYVHVAIQDAVARNGVIHVVDHVLLPHKKPGEDLTALAGEIDVEDLKERLAPFVEDSENEWVEL